jgi:hypothetical protein
VVRWNYIVALPRRLRICFKGSTTVNESLALLPAERKSPPPKLLSSDDESSPPTIPSTLRSIPHFYPSLPPKHTYLRTPVCIPILLHLHLSHPNATAFTTKETSVAVFGEEIEKRKPCSRVVAKSSLGDGRRRWAG